MGVDADGFAFDMDVRDYREWTREASPVFLMLFDAQARAAYWFYVQRYFEANRFARPAKGAKTVRIRVPRANRVDVAFMSFARECLARVVHQASEVVSHAE